MKKRLLSMLLASVLFIGVMPVQIPAAEEVPEEETTEEMPEEETTEMVSEDEIIGNDENGIPDEFLYRVILEKADSNGDGILTKEEAAGITELGLGTNLLMNLTGIQYCENLKSLSLSAEFNDISVLGELTNLRYLELSFSEINDVSVLGELTNLKSLNLNYSTINDSSGLSELTNLERLSWKNSNVSDITIFSDLTSLTDLELSNNEISNISALSNLTNLNRLILGYNNISDISALSSLVNLEYLNLEHNEISEISALSGMTRLWHLDLHHNNITDFSALSELDIQELRVDKLVSEDEIIRNDESGIPDPVLYQKIIRQVDVDDDGKLTKEEVANTSRLLIVGWDWGNTKGEIANLKGIEYFSNLNSLYLTYYSIDDISVLAELNQLNELYLQGNNISDISALSGLTNLSYLDLGQNDISDISALSNLTNLNRLELYCNNISDIIALSNLTDLRYLDLNSNQVSDISALSNLTKLGVESWQVVNLSNNFISDFSVLDDRGISYLGKDNQHIYQSPTDSTGNASAVIDGETIEFPVNSDAEAGCTTDKQKSAFEIIMEMIRRLIGEVGEDATKIYAPILQEYAKISVKKVWLAECIDIQKPEGVDMSQGVAVTFPAKVNKGDTVIVLHLDEEGNWEQIKDAEATADGWITGTFRSLSPVFYFKVETESAVTGDGLDSNGNTSNGDYDGWAGVSAEQKAKLMQESLAQKTAVVASPKTDDANANINASVMLLLVAALCGAALYGKKKRMNV